MSAEFSPKPYRVEWRFAGNQQWQFMRECDDHEEAIGLTRTLVNQHEGYARAIVQHVFERFDAGQAKRERTRRPVTARTGPHPSSQAAAAGRTTPRA